MINGPKAASGIPEILRRIDVLGSRRHLDEHAAVGGQLPHELAKTDIAGQRQYAWI